MSQKIKLEVITLLKEGGQSTITFEGPVDAVTWKINTDNTSDLHIVGLRVDLASSNVEKRERR